ncbi:MAG: glycine--tRNA ligase [Candidatus Actinomarina sp.]|jgi:glycyl-tRNA synthetase|nr:glycine--tRNA ligase [Candidatus Actinomarina sp.]MBL6762606.1 glycine--tRNA ligase [Candidatus Actinomarina sp.]
MEETNKDLFEKVVKIAQARGFVFNASSIYGGLRSSYDYGPLGVLLKNSIATYWWKDLNLDNDISVFPVDTAIIQSSEVWKASGHLAEFSDPMVDHKPTGERFRVDQVPENLKKEDLTEPRQFNLMFETSIGPIQNENSSVYLRPETAQGIFVNFENVLRTMRAKIPFGIANIGKSFRNEITPGQFIFRTREFEQMEIEFFCKEEDEDKWFDYWVNKRMNWYKSIGIPETQLRLREHSNDELAHYAKKTVDIEFKYPWGWGELEGIANRGTFDLSSHENSSGKDLSYFDPESDKKIIPTVIEPAGGLTRTLFALLCSSYDEDTVGDTTRTLFRFDFNHAPIQIGILPLSKKDDLINISNKIKNMLQEKYRIEIDITQSIGKRYRRQDEIGTPYCITVDFDTLDDKSVTIRNRDTMEQERISIENLLDYFSGI